MNAATRRPLVVVSLLLAMFGTTSLAAQESAGGTTLDPIAVTGSPVVPPRMLDDGTGLPYPSTALSWRREGTVVVSAQIGADGRVGAVSIKRSSGYASLDRAALAHIQARPFAPATHRGNAVASRVAIPVTFELSPVEAQALAAR